MDFSLILIRRIPQTVTGPRQRKNGRYVATAGDRPVRFREPAHRIHIRAHGEAVLGERNAPRLQSQERILAAPATASWKPSGCGDAPNFLAANTPGRK